MGAGGFAYGKGHSPRDAVARASKAAKRDLRFVERFRDTSLLHDVRGKHNNCIVDIYAKPPGSGIVGGPLGRRILTQLGFSSFTIKARGRRTPYSYCAAAFDALSKHRSVEEIARSRGRRILEIEHAAARHARAPSGSQPGRCIHNRLPLHTLATTRRRRRDRVRSMARMRCRYRRGEKLRGPAAHEATWRPPSCASPPATRASWNLSYSSPCFARCRASTGSFAGFAFPAPKMR